jgi:hypothetical protein
MPRSLPVARCMVCRRPAVDVKVLRFSLIRSTTRTDGRKTTRGCGSIDLCGVCWDNSRIVTGTKRQR